MIVCCCNRVTEEIINRLVIEKYSLEEIKQAVGVGNGCGKCLDYIQQLLNSYNALLVMELALRDT
jgi:bacterioferritin-associated ferredoxin